MTKPPNRRGSFYWLDGKPYISVTNVLSIINKPQLMIWFGKEVYNAVIKDPSISEDEAMAAPNKIRDKAADRGSLVHSLIEAWKHTQTEIDNVPDQYRGYIQAFYKWTKEFAITDIIAHEKEVRSDKYRYAGTLDLLVKSNNNIILVDIKTGKGIYETYHMQVSAYKQALSEMGTKVDGAAILLLRPTGTYIYETTKDMWRAFYHCLGLYRELKRDYLEKMGLTFA